MTIGVFHLKTYHLTTSVDNQVIKIFTKASLFILGGFFVLLSACDERSAGDSNPSLYQIRGEAQGTTYLISYYAQDSTISKAEIDSVLKKIDNSLSNWVPSSLISSFNNSADTSMSIQDSFGLLSVMFDQSMYFYEISDGAFDPSVMPLVSSWGFGLKNRELMDSSKVDSILDFVGFKKSAMFSYELRESNKLIAKKHPAFQLDFNAIAQGYSVDLIAEYLESKKLKAYMVELGGEMRLGEAKPDGSKWKVGIDKPMDPSKGREIQTIIELANQSIATSGSYRKFYEKDGMRYSHTIDPKTGFPVSHNLLSASVIAKTAAEADAMATILMVLGLEKGKEFISGLDEVPQVYLIYQAKDGELKVYEN